MLKRSCLMSLLIWASACGGNDITGPTGTVCSNAPSGSYSLRKGETLRVSFSVAANSASNMLITDVGFAGSSSSAPDTMNLFNGNTLLGTQQPGGTGFWKSANSAYAGPATTIDFAAIQNGSIDGRLDFVAGSDGQFDLTRVRMAPAVVMASGVFTPTPGTIRSLALVSTSCH